MTDIDECALPKHDRKCEQNCTNTPGSYVCSCNDGYSELSGMNGCTKIGNVKKAPVMIIIGMLSQFRGIVHDFLQYNTKS